jgi:predicted amidohydrolase YtcJ
MNKNKSLKISKKAFINGKIFTVNEKQPIAESVIIHQNRIVFVGSNSEANSLTREGIEIIDLKGKLMLPGFIDSHVHFISSGLQLSGINLRKASSEPEFKKILMEYALLNKNKWITGGGWNHELFENRELPDKEWIDSFTPDTPVFISRSDGHMGLANSLALKLAGIKMDSQNPDGGIILKDPDTGEPTGILKDNAMNLIQNIIPNPSDEEYERALFIALEETRKNGVTSIHDITMQPDLKLYQKIEKENKLSCRIYSMLPIADYKNLISQGNKYNYGIEKLKTGALKAFADGSLGSNTALFFDVYENEPSNNGIATDILTNGRLREWSLDADKNNLQLAIHAIGDKANSLILDLFEELKKTNPERDRRLRIEHAQHVRSEDIKRFANQDVIASVQPYHVIDDGCWAEKKIGKERLSEIYSFNTFIKAGVTVCFGSDWNVAPMNPLYGIYAAVTRRTLDNKYPDGWIPEQKISVEQAIKCYTINGAYASFEENLKGSIEKGKLADFVILNEDILKINPTEIKGVEIKMTVYDGEVIFNKE